MCISYCACTDNRGAVTHVCWPCRFPQLDRELHFGYQKNGSLVVAFSAEEEAHLGELLLKGKRNGVKRLRIVQKEELFRMEPHLNPAAIAALYSPDAGNLIPYEYAIALAENAVDNGVELRIRREVRAIDKAADGSFVVHAAYWEPRQYAEQVLGGGAAGGGGSLSDSALSAGLVLLALAGGQKYFAFSLEKADVLTVAIATGLAVAAVLLLNFLFSVMRGGGKGSGSKGAAALPSVGSGGTAVTVDEMRVGGSGSCSANDGVTVARESIKTRFIVNCAGGAADKISSLIGDNSFEIKPRLGDYIILSREQGKFARHTIFPCPDPVLGKGVLVQTTLWGMLILGPTARDTYLPEVMSQSHEDVQNFILQKCRQLVPSFDPKETIASFCGCRAKSTRGDWIIEPSAEAANFIQAAGIDSPGNILSF
jgi:L-2-hydroxyglutarate oxidase LhgO